jgi:D-3-phosphoglycerate dehydrogenase
MKKVLITSRSFGKVSNAPGEILCQAGIEVVEMQGEYDEDAFISLLKECDALIIGAHQLTERAIVSAPKLKLVCKHGAGLDNIDLELAKKYGLTVTNVPGTNSNAVADLTFALMLDVARKVSYGAATVKQGQWNKIIGTDVCGKTLGLIGFGAIASNVAKRAKGFQMKVLAYDPFVKAVPEELSFVELVSFEQVVAGCDFLSVHVPLNRDTKGLVNQDIMSRMKKGSFIVNTSRGGIVDEAALYDAVASGHIAGAGLDVTEQEPPHRNPLLTLDNVTIVPHIGMYSVEAINAVSQICAENVAAFAAGKEVRFKVV